MWENVRLGEVCEVIAGQSPASETYNQEKLGLPFFQGKADFGTLYPSIRYWCSKPIKISEPEDILFSLRAPVGPTNINNIKACIGRGLAAIRPSSLVSLKYLLHYLRSNERTIAELGTGSTFKAITVGALKNIEISLPPLPVQQRIADTLDKADALRRKDQELLKKFEELAQAIFIDMFGDPVKNEKGWEVKKLGELGKLDRGISKHRPRNAPELLGGDYPLIQTGDVANSGGWIKSFKTTYSEIGLKQSKIWNKGTLCITIAANIAKTGILTFDSCFPDSIVGFISNDLSNEVFVQYWFSFFQKILEEQAPESAQKNINLAILRALEVIAPPLPLQQAFAQKIELITQLKVKTNAEKPEELFRSLLQRVFRQEKAQL